MVRRGSYILFVVVATIGLGTAAFAAPYAQGDVFAAIGGGQVAWFNSTGTLISTLNDGQGGFTTGMAFNAAGDLFVTNFGAGSVSEFDNSGNLLNATFVTGISAPEAIVFNSAGNMLVTSVGGTGITEYSPTGTLLNTFIAGTRTDWMDLAANQNTMYYTDESGAIHVLDLPSNTKQADLINGLGGGAALRILSDGSILLAAEGAGVVDRVLPNGTVSQIYSLAGIGFPFALNVDPDGTSFWTADPNGNIVRVDIASGAILTSFNSGSGSTFGLTVFGERVVSTTPEPSSILLMGTGLLGLAGVVRRKFML